MEITQNKTVTVIIPTYNYAGYIGRAIDSVLNQTYPQSLIEIIIVDDGSTDGTAEVVDKYLHHQTIKYYFQENEGKASATQKAISLASGEILFNLDADDYFFSNKIEEILKIYELFPTVSYVGHPAKLIRNGNLENTESIPNAITNRCFKGDKLVEFYLKEKSLYGGGSTFSARTSTLKSNIIPSNVDMYIDEYLIFESAIYGEVYISDLALSVWRIHGKNYSVDKSSDVFVTNNNRLVDSSVGMLNYVQAHELFSNNVKRLYNLRHYDRYWNGLEARDDKKITDIFRVVFFIVSFRYSFVELNKYKIFNRLLPTKFIRLIKSLR